MLRAEHSIVVYTNGRACPDRLTRARHGHYLNYAGRMLAVYQSGTGLTRRELHHSIENILAAEPDCERRRIAAFCKLLDECAEFERDPRGAAAALRLRVFASAAKCHPLVSQPDRMFFQREMDVKRRIAAELGRPWDEISSALYADVIAYQRLRKFHGYPSAEALLSGYNVRQLQACLYRAESLSVTAGRDFKTILRCAKLCRLLHEIRRLAPGRYRIDLSGPVSVLEQTRRYGVNLARFVPALLACRDWSMRAVIRTRRGARVRMQLSDADRLCTRRPPPQEFDSSVEEAFAKAFGDERAGWRLCREGAVLHEGQTTFVPDFVFRRADGCEVFLEIVGFWTPRYLQKKREMLFRFRRHRIVLAVAERNARVAADSRDDLVVYRKAIDPDQIVRVLDHVSAGATGV